MTKDEVLRLAFEALHYCEALNSSVEKQKMQAITAIKKALAQPERDFVGLTDEEARVKFESWHKAEYVQPLERYGHTYKNMHVRNRWQGWLAANGIKEKKHD